MNIAVASSSVLKGETLADTAMNIEAMAPDMIVIRHASSGACHLLSRICRSRIINAGDGMHEHPTQALLDAFTIRQHKPSIERLKKMRLSRIAPGHGDVIEEPKVKLDDYISHRKQRESQILRALKKRGSAKVKELVEEGHAGA